MKDFSTLSTEDLEKEISRIESLMSNTQDEDTILRREAENNGIDYNLFKAIDQHESGGRADAISPTGVKGRFQITGDTFKRYGGTNRDDFNDVAKVAGKIVGGLKQKYGGDIPKMMAAYNTGEGVVDEAERLANEKGTNWLDEIQNTKSIDKVTDQIMRAKLRTGQKVGTFDEEKASKVKEVNDHRNTILNIYNKNLTRDFSSMSTEDLEKMIDELSGEQSTIEQPTPTQESQQIQSSEGKGFFGQLASTPRAAIRGTWEGITNALSSALNAESAKQGSGQQLWNDFIEQRGGNVKKVIDPTTGAVEGDQSKELTKIANGIKEMVPEDWKEYDEKLASGGKGKYLNPEFWTNQVFQQVPNFVQSMAMGPQSILTMSTTEKGAFVERVRQIEEATGKPIDPVILNKYADNYGTTAGLLEAVSSAIEVGPFKGIGKDFKNALKKSLIKRVGKELGAMGIDGATETSQSLDENAMLGKLLKEANYSEEDVKNATAGWKDEAIESFVLGFGTAGIMRGAGKVTSKLTQPQVQPTATSSTTAEQTQQEIQPTPEMAGQLPQETEDFAGSGTPEQFVAKYNEAKTEDDKQFLMSLLSDDELNVVNEQLATPEAIQTEEATTVAPTEEVTPEQPQTALEEPLILDETLAQEIPSEEESKEAGQALLTEDTAVEQPTAESTPYIFEDLPETQESNVAPPTSPKEITATEEQLKSVKEKVSGIEGNVKPEIEQKNPAVEPVEVKPTEPVSTKQETTEKPVEIKTKVEPQPEETVTPVVQRGKAKTELPNKEPTKYTYNDLMSIYEGDTRNGPKKIAEIAKAAGVEVAPKQRYYTTMYNYLLKHGSEEDASKAEKLFNKKSSIDVSRNIRGKQMERLETTGDTRKEGRQEVIKFVDEITNSAFVPYDPKKHSNIIKDIVKNEETGKFNIIYKKKSDKEIEKETAELIKQGKKPVKQNPYVIGEYKKFIEVKDYNGKPYISLIDESWVMEALERKNAEIGIVGGKGQLVEYKEAFNNEQDVTGNDQVGEDEDYSSTFNDKEQTIDEIEDEATDTFQNSPEFEESMKMLSNMRASGVLSEEKYKLAVNKLMDDYDDVMTRYSTTGPREVKPSIKDEILSGKAAEMEVLSGTEQDKLNGKSIAKSIPEIKFNGIQEGFAMGKVRHEPKLYFTIKDAKQGSTFALPLNATKEDVVAKLESVKYEFKKADLKRKTAEVVKFFKNKDTLPEIRLDDSVKSRSGKRDRKLGKKDYGAITKEDGKPVILINPNIDPKEMIPTLIHELVGHYGASKVFNEIDIELAQHMRDLFEKDKGSKFTKQVYETYKDQIDKNPNVLFDEWVAKRFEEIAQEYFDKDGNFIQEKYDNDKFIRRKVYDTIKSLVGKTFDKWFQRDATEEEIRDAVKATLQRMPDVVPKTYDKVETRQSRKPRTRAEFEYELNKDEIEKIKPKKRKRIAPKQLTRGEKLGTYVTDFLHLRTADSAKKIKIRFYDFANRYFYSKIGEVSPESYRKQIFNLISKVKTPNDEYHKQALELVNEFSDFIDTTRAYNEYKKFKKTHEKWLNKDDTRLDGIKHTMSHIDKMYEQYSDYHNLKRVSDRVTVFRPFKAGTTELTNPSERYQRLIDNNRNWIDPNFTDKEGKHYYKITPAGREAINKLKRDLTDPETKQMFNTGTLNVLLNGIKQDIKTKFKDEITLVKKEKKLNYERGIVDILGQLNQFDKKTLSDIKNKTLRDSLKWIKEKDMTASNLEYINEHLDNFEKGMFTKHIFDKLDKGRRDSLRFGQEMSDFLKDGLKDIPIDELRSYSDAFFSGSLSMITAEKARKLKTTNFKLKNRHGVAEDVKLTPSQRISVYMLSKNEDGIRHLLEGGFSLDKTGMIYKLSPEDIEVINNTVKNNTNEMKVVDLLFKYYEKQGRAINRVSNKDVGHDIAVSKNHHPILVRGDEVQKRIEEISSMSKLRDHIYKFSPDNLKARNGSSAPIILEGAFEALSRTSDLVEHYVGRAMPAKYVETILKDKQVQQTMNNKGLDVEYTTMRKLLDEYQKSSSFRSGVGDKFLRAVQNMFTVATLGYKVGTAALQIPGAYLFLNEMGKDQKLQTLKGLTKPRPEEVDKVIELISKWNPVLRNRFDNHVDRDWGEAANKYRTRNMFIGPEKLTPKNFIKKALSSEGAMSMITSIDRYTITQLWKGTEAYAEYKGLKRGSDEFYKFVSNEVERIVRRTQPTYDVLDRPLVTQAAPLFRALTMFTSQPIKMLAMTRRAMHQIKSGDRDKVLNGIFGLSNLIIMQPIMIESIRYAWKALQNDIDPEDYDEGLDIIKNLSANVVGMYPIIGSFAASWLQGFKPNVGGPLQEVVNRSIDLTNTLLKSATEGVDTEKNLKAAKRLAEIWKPISGVEQIGKFFVAQYNNAIDFYHESRGR